MSPLAGTTSLQLVIFFLFISCSGHFLSPLFLSLYISLFISIYLSIYLSVSDFSDLYIDLFVNICIHLSIYVYKQAVLWLLSPRVTKFNSGGKETKKKKEKKKKKKEKNQQCHSKQSLNSRGNNDN